MKQKIVYVLSKDNKPLMPITELGLVRVLLKKHKAKIINRNPFTIKLRYEVENKTQPLYLGIDPGRTNIGISVINEKGDCMLSASAITRNKDIPKLMAERKGYRQKHRNQGRRQVRRRRARANHTTKAKTFARTLPQSKEPIICHDIQNKEAKFCNRRRPNGWLTPTANQLLLSHINLIHKVCKLLPITDVVIEQNKFAFMQMDNPNIQRWEFQKGKLFGYKGNVNLAVSEQQEEHCIFCKSKIDHFHHIVPRHKNGSDTIDNIVGLCEKHHSLVHTNSEWVEKMKIKKNGMNKKYHALSVLNQIIPFFLKELSILFPNRVYTIQGFDTKQYRMDNELEKDHHLDAYCIASVVTNTKPCESVINKTYPLYDMRQFRRHDRQACHKEMINRCYLLDNKVVATNRHKAFEQKEKSLEEFCNELIEEYEDKIEVERVISSLHVKKHTPIMKNINRILPGSMFLDNDKFFILQRRDSTYKGKVYYYIDTNGIKHKAKDCKFIQNNRGWVFC